ncbi:MAG: ATP-binding cassette domain-containing protein [Blastochloris sp.]|nr:ATP-binding cassette domain-containing protein [Blastochloris sp.]
MKNVGFSYTSKSTLENLNLTIPYGQKIALVGPSGAGKSTIVQLLLRLYDPQSGRIRIENVPLNRCLGADLRRCFGVVPQSPYFFQATLRETCVWCDRMRMKPFYAGPASSPMPGNLLKNSRPAGHTSGRRWGHTFRRTTPAPGHRPHFALRSALLYF